MIGTVNLPPHSRHWYAAQVQSCKERLAATHLNRQGFETFSPTIGRSRIVRKRRAIVHEALFPGYVFVTLETGLQRWRSINGTIGVSRIVTFGSQPAALPTGFVERLQELSDEDGDVSFEENFSLGDQVRIMGGAFDNVCGTLATFGGADRVTVLLQLLSGETKVTLSRRALVAV